MHIIILTVLTTPISSLLDEANLGGSFFLSNIGDDAMDANKSKRLKEFKTLDEQLDLLENRGLIIYNKEKTKKILRNTNYYRLSAYYKPFYIRVDYCQLFYT